MPPKRGRPAKGAALDVDVPKGDGEGVAAAPAPASASLTAYLATAPEIPPPTDHDEIKEIAVVREEPEPFPARIPPPPPAETPLTWRQRIVHELLEEEYRNLVREQITAGTLAVDHPEDREMMQEISELRKNRPQAAAATPSVAAPAPVTVDVQWPSSKLPVEVQVQAPAGPTASPSEWAEEFGVLMSTFFQTDKGVTLADALERQTKVWLRVSQQLERLNGLVASLLHDEDPLDDLSTTSAA